MQIFFQFEMIITLSLSASVEFLCYGCTNIINLVYLFSAGTVFIRSESDVYRRQILTDRDGPRAERVNHCPVVYIDVFKNILDQ